MTELVIQTTGLTKDHISHFLHKRFRGLDNVTLAVSKGETYGLLGPNGAGKTTTLKLLLGLLKPTAGEISVLGLPAGDQRALSRIGFLPENPYFYSYLTGFELLDFCGQLFNLPGKERRERCWQLLEMVSLVESKDKPIRKFSKGMLQRLGIAQCLINDPMLIFLDEPNSGLDPIGRREVRQVLVKLKEEGKTIFFNSHLLPDVNELCDRIGVLHRGKLVGEGDVKRICQNGNYHDLEEYFVDMVVSAERQFQGPLQ